MPTDRTPLEAATDTLAEACGSTQEQAMLTVRAAIKALSDEALNDLVFSLHHDQLTTSSEHKAFRAALLRALEVNDEDR